MLAPACARARTHTNTRTIGSGSAGSLRLLNTMCSFVCGVACVSGCARVGACINVRISMCSLFHALCLSWCVLPLILWQLRNRVRLAMETPVIVDYGAGVAGRYVSIPMSLSLCQNPAPNMCVCVYPAQSMPICVCMWCVCLGPALQVATCLASCYDMSVSLSVCVFLSVSVSLFLCVPRMMPLGIFLGPHDCA